MGLHFMAAAGLGPLSWLKGSEGGFIVVPRVNYKGTGAGFTAGGGYESWIGEQWSLGLLARIQYAKADLAPENGVGISMESAALRLRGVVHGLRW